MMGDPEFERREGTLFLQALYFLTMDERCHAGLENGTRRRQIQRLNDAARAAAEHQMELEADRCTIEIINADEPRYQGWPISYFGVLMTVAT